MFLKRKYTPELMDDFTIDDERIEEALAELKIINRWLGGNSTTRSGFNKVSKILPANQVIKILDVGSGASDIILSLGQNFQQKKIFALDLNKKTCRLAKSKSKQIEVTCGNILAVPFKQGKFDLVHASLFVHHFGKEEIKKILTTLLALTNRAVIINDIHRSLLALWGIKILTSLFSKSEFVKNDAPLSVKRAFVKKELVEILNELNFHQYKIIKKWAFRWLIIIYKDAVE